MQDNRVPFCFNPQLCFNPQRLVVLPCITVLQVPLVCSHSSRHSFLCIMCVIIHGKTNRKSAKIFLVSNLISSVVNTTYFALYLQIEFADIMAGFHMDGHTCDWICEDKFSLSLLDLWKFRR